MPLALCITTVDSSQRELVEHGTNAFPIACYHDDLEKEEVPWHWHEEWEAVVVSEGTTLVAAGNKKFEVKTGEGFFINSRILHGGWDVDNSGCRYHSIVFHPKLVGGNMDSVFYQEYVNPIIENVALEGILLTNTIPWQKSALEAIECAWQACVHEPEGYEMKVRNELSELVFLLRKNIPTTGRKPSAKQIRDGERIKQILQFIHDNYAKELSAAKIAEVASISESECLRCFKTTIGTTPMQYVRHYRIQQACQMLASSDAQISDVMHTCGFTDLSYFTKTFREMKGCTPGEYRRQNG